MPNGDAGNQNGQNSDGNSTAGANQSAGSQGQQNSDQAAGKQQQQAKAKADAAAGAAGASDAIDGDGAGEKSFSQTELNRILAKEKSKWEKNKDLDETERLRAENEELKKAQAERDSFESFEAAAKAVDARNPKALFKLVKDELEIKDGKITNLKDVMKAAVKEYPELFTSADGGADGGSGGSKTNRADMNDWIRSHTGRGR
jgi:hypothetical protein